MKCGYCGKRFSTTRLSSGTNVIDSAHHIDSLIDQFEKETNSKWDNVTRYTDPTVVESNAEKFFSFYDEIKNEVKDGYWIVYRTIFCTMDEFDITIPFNHCSIKPHWNAYARKLGDNAPDDGVVEIGKTRFDNIDWFNTVSNFFVFLSKPEYEVFLIDKVTGSGVEFLDVKESMDNWRAIKSSRKVNMFTRILSRNDGDMFMADFTQFNITNSRKLFSRLFK